MSVIVANPNPARITDASWWLMCELLALEPGTRNGGIYAFKGGYHNTRYNLLTTRNTDGSLRWPWDYSLQSPNDQGGPSDKAAAYDWTFPSAQAGDYRRIMLYMQRIRTAYLARDERIYGWREALGQADPDLYAEGYNFGWPNWYERVPDSSHLWHIHLGENRRWVADYENKRKMLSVLSGQSLADYKLFGYPRKAVQPQMFMTQVRGEATIYLSNGAGEVALDLTESSQLVAAGVPLLAAHPDAASMHRLTRFTLRASASLSDPTAFWAGLAGNPTLVNAVAEAIKAQLSVVPTSREIAQEIAGLRFEVTPD